MSRRSRAPYTVLGCLTLQPVSGYDVERFPGRAVVHFCSDGPGQIDPALREPGEEVR